MGVMRVSVDVGGTFTDVIVMDEVGGLRLEKVETTPHEPERGVLEGFDKAEVALPDIGFFVHGMTLGINALLTSGGARVAIITTLGFRDVYELGRTDREPMYDFKYRKPPSLVPRHRVFEVDERMTFQGDVHTPFDRLQAEGVAASLRASGVTSVAVCFLHSYANPEHELAMERILGALCPEVSVTLSHRLLREYREYERTSTAVIDAYIKPLTRSYLDELDGQLGGAGFAGQFLLMRSGGGAMTLESAKEHPVHLVLSGPAGGVIGAAHLSDLLGTPNLITIDMGGTSLDVSLIEGGRARVEHNQAFRTLPISIPTLDIHTIGAGGGSIAWIDDGGHLQVGPQSAGAVPGPACYGKGGTEATFTDAALAVGYLDPDNFLGGEIGLDSAAAETAIATLAASLGLSPEETASGILRIGEAKIAGAVREISIERGYHPKDFALLAFGGAGALVAAGVARELGIPRVIVPLGPANFSAFGMLMVDVVHDFSQTHVTELSTVDIAAVNAIYASLVARGRDALTADGFAEDRWQFLPSAQLRYQGQEHAVTLPLAGHELTRSDIDEILEDFGAAHRRQYGHSMKDPVEIVTLRLRAVGLLLRPHIPELAVVGSDGARRGQRAIYLPAAVARTNYAVFDRARLPRDHHLKGPAIIEEPSSTTVLHAGDAVRVGAYGELVIDIGSTEEETP